MPRKIEMKAIPEITFHLGHITGPLLKYPEAAEGLRVIVGVVGLFDRLTREKESAEGYNQAMLAIAVSAVRAVGVEFGRSSVDEIKTAGQKLIEMFPEHDVGDG